MAKKKFNLDTTVEDVKSRSFNHVPIGNQLQNTVKEHIVILPELEFFIRKLNASEYHLLSEDIRQNGCKEAIKLWRRENDFVIVDGHHRFQICKELGIEFKTESLEFSSLDEVKIYMAKLQLGRRNLTVQETSYLRGMQYSFAKKGIGESNQKEGNTRDLLASEYGVSSATISRDFLVYQAVEKLPLAYKQDFLNGDSFLQKQDLEYLAKNDCDVLTFLKNKEKGEEKETKIVETKPSKEVEVKNNYVSSFSSRFLKTFEKSTQEEKLIYKQQLLDLLKKIEEI